MSRSEKNKNLEATKAVEWPEEQIIIIDDQESRTRDLLRQLAESGVATKIPCFRSFEGSRKYLEAVVAGKSPPPRLIFLDHMFLYDSTSTEMEPLGDLFLSIFRGMQRKRRDLFGETRIVVFSNIASRESHGEEFDKVIGEVIPPLVIAYVDPDSKEYENNPQQVIEKIKQNLKKQGLLA